MQQWRRDALRFYQTYGWDRYDDFVFHDKEALLKYADEIIDCLGDNIYMVENEIMPIGTGETKEGLIAFYNARIEHYKAFMEKAKTDNGSDIRTLSGELDYMFEIHENLYENLAK